MIAGVVTWAAIAVVSGILAAFIATRKNRDYSSWAAWCFLFPPLLIALLLTPKNPGPPPRRPTLDELERNQF